MLIYYQSGPQEQTSVKFKSKNKHFLSRKHFENAICKMLDILYKPQYVNSLRPRQDGRHFPDDIFIWIFLNENVWISIEISLKFVSKGSIKNIPAWVQIMAWRRSGDKPLSEPMTVSLPMHICITRPQWVNRVMFAEYWWLGARLQYLYCISNGDTAVLH